MASAQRPFRLSSPNRGCYLAIVDVRFCNRSDRLPDVLSALPARLSYCRRANRNRERAPVTKSHRCAQRSLALQKFAHDFDERLSLLVRQHVPRVLHDLDSRVADPASEFVGVNRRDKAI